jgi:hypothetical protein
MHTPPRSRPARRCLGAADHHDPAVTNYLHRSDTRQRASLRRRDEKEEFMMRTNVQRLGEHVTAALLGQVTPMSEEVAIVAGGRCTWSRADGNLRRRCHRARGCPPGD